MKKRKNLKEKVLFLMCLGALAGNMSVGVYAQEVQQSPELIYEIDKDNPEIKIKDEINLPNDDNKDRIVIKKYYVSNEENKGSIEFNGKIKIDKNNYESQEDKAIHLDTDSSEGTVLAKFNNDLSIKTNGYALYSGPSQSSALATVSIIVGEKENNSKIQIIGNLGVKTEYNGNTAEQSKAYSNIELNLNNEDSFFAGKMLAYQLSKNDKDDGKIEGENKIILNLKNSATWYVHNSNGIDSYNISGEVKDDLNGKLQTLITSDGGVIDIYHIAPDESPLQPTSEQLGEIESLESQIEEMLNNLNENSPEYKYLEMMFVIEKAGILGDAREKGERTFTLNGVGDKLKNTTFRISSDVEKGTADKIVLNGVKVNKDSETYSIQVVADPFKSGEWKAGKDDKILVMDINAENSNIDDLNKITVEGKEYTTDIAAGLVKQTIIPTIEEDENNKGDWYLTGIEKVDNQGPNQNSNKGDGHIFAELGAGTNAGMATAWRADNGDIYQRMGNLRNNEAEQGIWGRIYTGENEVRKGIGLDLEYRAVQVGYDRKNNISDGKLFTGVAFGYFDGNVDYDHGSGESNSATVGAYATYLGRNGAYSDFIVKFGNIDNKLSYSSDNGNYYKADFDTYGLSADAEYGYRYDFSNNYYIEPLAQLSYIYIADEDYTMKLNGKSGAKVSNDDYQSLIGYTGFHYGKKFDDSVVYLRAVLAHEFAGDIDVKARYENTKVNSSISGEDTWVEYGVGFDVKVKEDTAIYGRVQRTTGDVVKNKWHASVGLRYTF